MGLFGEEFHQELATKRHFLLSVPVVENGYKHNEGVEEDEA